MQGLCNYEVVKRTFLQRKVLKGLSSLLALELSHERTFLLLSKEALAYLSSAS